MTHALFVFLSVIVGEAATHKDPRDGVLYQFFIALPLFAIVMLLSVACSVAYLPIFWAVVWIGKHMKALPDRSLQMLGLLYSNKRATEMREKRSDRRG